MNSNPVIKAMRQGARRDKNHSRFTRGKGYSQTTLTGEGKDVIGSQRRKTCFAGNASVGKTLTLPAGDAVGGEEGGSPSTNKRQKRGKMETL